MPATFDRGDLEHILQQILMAENGQPPVNPHLAFGLREVDGTGNNSVPGQDGFGAANQTFPRATTPVFKQVVVNVDGTAFDPNPGVAGDTIITSYQQTEVDPSVDPFDDPTAAGWVVDPQPRIISNLISDISSNNAAALQSAQEFGAQLGDGYTVFNTNPAGIVLDPGADGVFGTPDDPALNDPANLFIGNITPDAGLSAPFNTWMTLFGQFFDHGLDLVGKGGSGTVFIPLMPDDPLITHGPDGIAGNGDEVTDPSKQFMVVTRATNLPGPDGKLGTGDDIHENTNSITSFVDQNQTYASHPSHQVFLREYVTGADGFLHSTGRLLQRATGSDGVAGTDDDNSGMATWADVKVNALKLGIILSDFDVGNVPLLATDAYGNFLRGANGFVQLVMKPDASHASTWLKEGTAAGITTAGSVASGHAFLNDIAHQAAPRTGLTADTDSDVGLSNSTSPIPLSNESFETDSMASGAPGVVSDPVRGNYALIDPQGWDVTGFAGVFAPTAVVIDPAGHSGGNVVFLDSGATLVRNTGVTLVAGNVYALTFNVGDRLDQGFGGGTARLVTVDGDVLSTVALPTPQNGQWASVALNTGVIGAAHAGEELRIEIVQGGSGGSQILVDNVQLKTGTGTTLSFDNELLDAHYVAGDGRVNENIGLTAVHEIFHEEHNRLVEQVKSLIRAELANGDTGFATNWVLPGTDLSNGIQENEWNGERLFQVAKFGTETQYQHLVFEEFARKVAPTIHLFGNNDIHLDPAITAEFAHAVYRFGHSMLDETVPRFQLNADGTMALDADGQPILNDIGLIAAFLNPVEYASMGATAAAQLVQGTTHQIGSEIDEFVTGALRNNLVGLPLDLPAINIARGRDTGVPPINLVRAELFAATGDQALKPYANWAEFGQYMKHQASLINFVAAYGTHATVTGVTELAAKRAAALTLFELGLNEANKGAGGAVGDAYDFMHSLGAYANNKLSPIAVQGLWSTGSITGLDNVDLWIGGLAEKQNLFGGLLGSTFNFIFETQMEAIQDADRLYYLPRVEGMHWGAEIESNSFASMIIANTGAAHIPASIFLTPEYTVEASSYFDANGDPTDQSTWLRNPVTGALLVEVLPDGTVHFIGDDNFFGNTIVLGGTAGDDRLQAGHADDDTVWGDAGDDWIDGGNGNDFLFGGSGDDTIVDSAGDDVIRGEDGNDSIYAGFGDDIIFGNAGDDYIETGAGGALGDSATGGTGNDIIIGGEGDDALSGNEGDDWLEGGAGGDGLVGDTGAPTGQVPLFAANDVLDGGANGDKMVGFSGDDIMLGEGGFDRFLGGLGFDWADFEKGQFGVSVDMERREFIPNQQQQAGDAVRDFFIETEATSGSRFDDFIQGTEAAGGAAGVFNELTNVDLIENLNGFFAAGPVNFSDGNILLGGDGSDMLVGRGGNDILDGDAWLHVELTDRAAGGQIVRQIRSDITSGDVDTAVFRDVMDNYVVSSELDADGNPTGFTIVEHSAPVGGGVLVGGVFVRDGIDRVRNIERLQFADQTVLLDTALDANAMPGGTLTIEGDTDAAVAGVDPLVGSPLTAVSTITDADGINPASIRLQWQMEVVAPGGNVAWLDIAGANAEVFTPTNFQLGNRLRVVETYMDGHAQGFQERVVSAPTNLLAPDLTVNTAPFVVPQQGLAGLPDTAARTGLPINLFLPLTATFADNETAANLLTFTARLANGQPLSSAGLTFTLVPDAVNGGVSGARITGTVPAPGPIAITVSATDQGNPNVVDPEPAQLTATDTFVINVQTGNLAPSAAPEAETFNGVEDIQFSATLLPGDDPEDEALGFKLVQGSAVNGQASINGTTGAFLFKPGLEFAGEASFQYIVTDGLANSAPKTVTINFAPFNDGTALLHITGSATAGGTLSAVLGEFPDAPFGGNDPDGPIDASTINFEWFRDSIATGVTTADLLLTAGDVGHEFSVAATYVDAQGFNEIPVPAALAAPIGTLSVGVTPGATSPSISALLTVVDPDGGPFVDSVFYTWQVSPDGVTWSEADPASISADSLTFTPGVTGAAGAYVKVTAVFNDGIGNLETIEGEPKHYIVDATTTNLNLLGTAQSELIFGNGGADQITAQAGSDFVLGGGGNDTFFASVDDGDDTYNGGNGNDAYSLINTAAAATVDLSAGTATSAVTGVDQLIGIENVTGGAGADTLTGNGNANRLAGAGGTDALNGGGGNDTAAFAAGIANYGFTLVGGNVVVTDIRADSPDGADTLISIEQVDFNGRTLALRAGGNGGGTTTVNGADDLMLGFGGGDTLNSNGGNDVLVGGAGNDNLNGGTGVDMAVFTGPRTSYGFSLGGGNNLVVTDNRAGSPDGTDTLNSIEEIQLGSQTFGLDWGTNGVNTLDTGAGADLLFGFGGNDELDGGSGADIMAGGAGSDDFNFDEGDSGIGAGNRDIILDFLGGGGAEDIDLSAIDAITGGGDSIFTFIGTAAFFDPAGAATSAGQLRYQLFDSDGNGSLDSTLIQGNLNNDLSANFEILLQGYVSPLVAADFIL